MKILFFDKAAGNRSYMALGIWQKGDIKGVDAFCSSVSKGEIHPGVPAVLEEKGIDASRLSITDIDDLEFVDFDMVIFLEENEGEADKKLSLCPPWLEGRAIDVKQGLFPGAPAHIHWNIRDPLKN